MVVVVVVVVVVDGSLHSYRTLLRAAKPRDQKPQDAPSSCCVQQNARSPCSSGCKCRVRSDISHSSSCTLCSDTPTTRILSRRSSGSENATAVCGSVTLI